MDIKEREEIQSKGVNNLHNNIAVENFPDLKEERDIQVQEAFGTSKERIRKEISQIYYS
jgi:hypothetical protein